MSVYAGENNADTFDADVSSSILTAGLMLETSLCIPLT